MSKNLHTNDFRLKYIDLQNKKYGGDVAQVANLWVDSKLAKGFDLYDKDDK